MLNIRKENKIVDFKRDTKFYLKLADESAYAGDFPAAVNYVYKAYEDKTSAVSQISLYKKLGEYYAQMELYEKSNHAYFKALALDKDETTLFYEIGKNYFSINNSFAAFVYLERYLEKHFFEDEAAFAEDMIDFETENSHGEYQIVYPESKRDYSDMISYGRSLMRQSNFDEAIDLFSSVHKDNADYIYAQNNIVLCHFFNGDYMKALDAALKIFTIDKRNIFTLSNLVNVYNALEDEENKALFLARLLKAEIKDDTDNYKAATTLCEINEHGLAYERLAKILKNKPYDFNINILAALSLANLGENDKALRLLKDVAFYEKDSYILKYYIKLITRRKNCAEAGIDAKKTIDPRLTAPLKYVCQVQLVDMLEQVGAIKEALELSDGQFGQIFDLKKNEYELIRWAFTVGDYKLRNSIILKCVKNVSPECVKFLSDLLLSPQSPSSEKRELIYQLIKNRAAAYEIPYVIDDQFRILTPKYPRNFNEFPEIFIDVYANALSVCAYLLTDFETEIYKAFNKIYNKLKDNYQLIKSRKALAAALVYYCKPKGITRNKKVLCDIFEVSIVTLNKYIVILK